MRNLRKAVFEALNLSGETAKKLSEASGVDQSQISRFRKGGDISFANYQKLVLGLSPVAYDYFINLIATSKTEGSNSDIAEQLILLAEKLKESRKRGELAKVGNTN